jgi:hypothetical protein
MKGGINFPYRFVIFFFGPAFFFLEVFFLVFSFLKFEHDQTIFFSAGDQTKHLK